MLLRIITISLEAEGSQGEKLETFVVIQVRAEGGLKDSVFGGDSEK